METPRWDHSRCVFFSTNTLYIQQKHVYTHNIHTPHLRLVFAISIIKRNNGLHAYISTTTKKHACI